MKEVLHTGTRCGGACSRPLLHGVWMASMPRVMDERGWCQRRGWCQPSLAFELRCSWVEVRCNALVLKCNGAKTHLVAKVYTRVHNDPGE